MNHRLLSGTVSAPLAASLTLFYLPLSVPTLSDSMLAFHLPFDSTDPVNLLGHLGPISSSVKLGSWPRLSLKSFSFLTVHGLRFTIYKPTLVIGLASTSLLSKCMGLYVCVPIIWGYGSGWEGGKLEAGARRSWEWVLGSKRRKSRPTWSCGVSMDRVPEYSDFNYFFL